MNKENNIEDISRELIKAASITKAPQSFTANIMSKIEAHNTAKLTIIKPLISNGMWLLIGIITLFTTIITILYNKNTETTFIEENIPSINYNFLSSIDFTFPSLHLTNITLLAIASFGIFFIIQIFIIDKNTRTDLS